MSRRLATALVAALMIGNMARASEKTKKFEGNGIEFSYPENMRDTVDSDIAPGSVLVTASSTDSPTTYDVSFEVRAAKVTPEKAFEEILTGDALANRRKTVEEVKRKIGGVERVGKRVKFTLVIGFTSDFFVIQNGDATVLVNFQAADKDLAVAEPKFAIVSESLKIK